MVMANKNCVLFGGEGGFQKGSRCDGGGREMAKHWVEKLAKFRGEEIRRWFRVRKPVVGKCRYCEKEGIIDDAEFGLL